MHERPRMRETLGRTASGCPHCGGGPMMVTRSQYLRRLRDLVNPHFDPDVLFREVCTACGARFPIAESRVREALQAASSTTRAPVTTTDGAAPDELSEGPERALEITVTTWGGGLEAADTPDAAPAPAPEGDDVVHPVVAVAAVAPVDIVPLVGPAPRGSRSRSVGAGRRSGPLVVAAPRRRPALLTRSRSPVGSGRR